MIFEKWLKDPWQIKCSEYCPHKYDGGCGVCEKLGNKAPKINCYDCEHFIDFSGPNDDDRYSCITVYGFCKKDRGLIAYPYLGCLTKRKEYN